MFAGSVLSDGSRGDRGGTAHQRPAANSRTAEEEREAPTTGGVLSAPRLSPQISAGFSGSFSEICCKIIQNSQGLVPRSAAVTREIIQPSGWVNFAIACGILDKSQSIAETSDQEKKISSSGYNSTHLLSASWSLKATECAARSHALKHLLPCGSQGGFKH